MIDARPSSLSETNCSTTDPKHCLSSRCSQPRRHFRPVVLPVEAAGQLPRQVVREGCKPRQCREIVDWFRGNGGRG